MPLSPTVTESSLPADGVDLACFFSFDALGLERR